MGVDFRIRADGATEIEHDLALLQAKLGDLTPLMDIIGGVLEVDTQDNFAGEHAPDGTPWLPSIRAQETGGKTLQDSRRLYQSITHRATATSAEVGTNVIYAGRHQGGFHGTETVASHKRTMESVFGVKLKEPIEVVIPEFTRKGNTPARPFLGLSAHAAEEIAGHVADYVDVDSSGGAA
ncbi:phage virion morphogenesis protein [Sphingomonas sp. HMWF008]|nr:phage virion morphogenesis protein [Sphingomonas sp. HMWF008]